MSMRSRHIAELLPTKFANSRNVLTVHHTIKEAGQALRIQIAACCFNELSNKLVVIDKR